MPEMDVQLTDEEIVIAVGGNEASEWDRIIADAATAKAAWWAVDWICESPLSITGRLAVAAALGLELTNFGIPHPEVWT